jgi:hypothetical protein
MPSEAPDAVARWRGLAEEARTVADQMTDREAKVILLTIAQGYEHLAQRAEARKAQKDKDIKD